MNNSIPIRCVRMRPTALNGANGEALPRGKECLLGVKTGSPAGVSECPLLGEKQTSTLDRRMSAFSHKRTLALQHIGELQTYDSSSSSADRMMLTCHAGGVPFGPVSQQAGSNRSHRVSSVCGSCTGLLGRIGLRRANRHPDTSFADGLQPSTAFLDDIRCCRPNSYPSSPSAF